jgi:GTP pyrophosphokinase
MVLDSLKKYLPNYNSKYPIGFQRILEAFSENDYTLNDSNITLLWSAYQFGDDAHKGQKRKSGVPYFEHCIEVCIQLISWHMDIDVKHNVQNMGPQIFSFVLYAHHLQIDTLTIEV